MHRYTISGRSLKVCNTKTAKQKTMVNNGEPSRVDEWSEAFDQRVPGSNLGGGHGFNPQDL